MSLISRHLFLLALLLLLTPLAHAQRETARRALPPGIELTVAIEPKEVVLGDPFVYTVKLVGGMRAEEVNFPVFKDIPGLTLRGGPNQNQSFQFINGVTYAEQAWGFDLVAESVGQFTIPPARIKINGTWQETQPLTFTVKDVPVTNNLLGDVISARTRYPDLNRTLRGRYFAMMEVPEKTYRMQVIPVKVYVYRDPQLREFVRINISRVAGGDDFLSPEIQRSLSSRFNWERVRIGDQEFERTHVYTDYVVPTKSGRLNLRGPEIVVSLPVKNRYDDFFSMGAPTEQAELPLKMRAVPVLDIPQKPADAVLQAVGDISATVSTDATRIRERELLTVRVELVGEGFLDLVSPPEIPSINNLTLVDRKVVESAAGIRADLFLSKRIYEYVYQAANEGTAEVPRMVFAVFDPAKGEQRRIESKPVSVRIEPNDGGTRLITAPSSDGSAAGPAAARRPGARVLGDDVAYIDESPIRASQVRSSGAFYERPIFWLGQVIPVAIALFVGVGAVRARHAGPETAADREKRGRRAAEQALRTARGQIASASKSEFYATAHDGVVTYVASVLGRPAIGLTVEEAVDGLRAKGISADATAALEGMLLQLDELRFSPVQDDAASREALLSRAEKVMAELSAAG